MSSLKKSDVWLTVPAPPLVSLAQKWLKTAGFVAGISALTFSPPVQDGVTAWSCREEAMIGLLAACKGRRLAFLIWRHS